MRTIALTRPAPGQHHTLPLAGLDALVLSFNPSDAVFRRRDDALRLTFGDGATIAVTGFFTGDAIPPLPVTLADGTRMDAAEMLALFAPHLALPPASGLESFAAGGEKQPRGKVPADLSGLAADEEFVFSPENAQADDGARHNLQAVYQEVVFSDDEITIGPSVYGTLFTIGTETALHIHLNNNEAEMLDLDDCLARLPGLFPDSPPVRAIAVTGGADNRVILDGASLSGPLETAPLAGLGTTQFDRYAYRYGGGMMLALYIQTILQVAR
ncbi:hypothetical protein KL86DPRO_20405 [uncultured delta proteobacterium]|uniref:Uncharacterized protein n=1 Tax=uncultured delta proteobacterium TaxID=34034 RepID=A0A212K0C2_9DELT|nr:hypothetical protein KL86DPRO_20405 [uncultured delta proteobacterium]